MTPENCTYCHAPDNGTCAYPGEDREGCLLEAHRARVRAALRRCETVEMPKVEYGLTTKNAAGQE
jgi:hypothetical protein